MEKDAFFHDAVSSPEMAGKGLDYGRERKERAGASALRVYSAEKEPVRTAKGEVSDGESVETRFHVNEMDFPLFAQQVELEVRGGRLEYVPMSIDETMGMMVGSTAKTIEALVGESSEGIPKADHVIYLDKSARPVSWLVSEFWDDFTSQEEPKKTHLAIDRRSWLRPPYTSSSLEGHEMIRNPDGSLREANARDFNIMAVPREVLAGIHGLYVEGGIPEGATPDEVMAMPTILDGQNVTIVDEVSRSGATLGIAKELLHAAIPKTASINGHVFWNGGVVGNGQMKSAPAWYDPRRSVGRGVKDINELYYQDLYNREKTDVNRALMKGAFVLGEPLLDPENEPEQRSLRLMREIELMREEYDAGHILPEIPLGDGEVAERAIAKLEGLGVQFVPQGGPNDIQNPRSYIALSAKRKGRR